MFKWLWNCVIKTMVRGSQYQTIVIRTCALLMMLACLFTANLKLNNVRYLHSAHPTNLFAGGGHSESAPFTGFSTEYIVFRWYVQSKTIWYSISTTLQHIC